MAYCLPGCSPAQVINLKTAVNNLPEILIKNDCGAVYDPTSDMTFAYSVDGVCWSCYVSYDELRKLTLDFTTDYFLRIKLNGTVAEVRVDGELSTDYSTQLADCFDLTTMGNALNSPNVYNPYANMEHAVELQQTLTNMVSSMFGYPITYFKLNPEINSRDLTFKEYTLMNVESVKKIKLIIADGQMPSSRPEFGDFGFDWQTDWETEISKADFATAFGPTAQPMEGDLIYIPMQKRMWMVNESYEEKKDGLMWTATTFKVALVKYQEKGSVDLGDMQSLVDTLVKNKYDDIFGEDENIEAGREAVEAPKYAANSLYPVFESDACRKYVTCKNVLINDTKLYNKGALVADYVYNFTNIDRSTPFTVIYQHQFCGDNGTVSFLLKANAANYEGSLVEAGKVKLKIQQTLSETTISLLNNPNVKVTIDANTFYFVYLRWDINLNLVELGACKYTFNQNIPQYKLQPQHYYIDLDNPIHSVAKYDIEMQQEDKSDISMSNFYGILTNIKIYDAYIGDLTQVTQMYPTSNHLLVNDTARKLLDLNGVSINNV